MRSVGDQPPVPQVWTAAQAYLTSRLREIAQSINQAAKGELFEAVPFTTGQGLAAQTQVVLADSNTIDTVTLPPVKDSMNKCLYVARDGTGTAVITIAAQAGETIDYGASVTLPGVGACRGFFSDGIEWRSFCFIPIPAVISGGGGFGTVTSVAASVPSFLSISGSPITTSGTLAITYSGTALPVANGGTGGTSASGARTNLGLVIGTDVQAFDSDLQTIAGLTATTDNFIQAKSSAWASRTLAQVRDDLQGSGLTASCVGFREIPQNSQSANYTTVAADSGKHILHPAADTNARTFTIDSNANVAYPIGTCITFVNETSQVLSIAITSDTLTLAGTTTTGTRSLAQNGNATALKVTSTKWIISGTGLS